MKILTILFLLLLRIDAFGAVARDSGETDSTSACVGCSSDTWSHTVTAGSDLAIFCDVAANDFYGGTTIEYTYNSASLTAIGSVDASGGYFAHSYRRLNPATGINDATVTYSAAMNAVTSCRSFTGVHQSNPTSSVVTDSNTESNPVSVAITVLPDSLGYDAGSQATEGTCTGVTATGTAGHTERYDLCNSAEPALGGFGGTNASTGTITHSYTATAAGGRIGMLAFSIYPAVPALPAAARRRAVVVQ